MKQEQRIAKREQREAEQEQKRILKAERLEARDAQDQSDAKMAGREIASELLTMGLVTIYEHGYIVVKAGFGRAVYQKLVSFEVFSDNLTKKTGLGRAAGAVLTMGLNLVSPNTRGDLIVTIVTDKGVISRTLLPDPRVIASVKRLESAAAAVLRAPEKVTEVASVTSPDLAASLEKLLALKNSGALTELEFQKAKAQLLS